MRAWDPYTFSMLASVLHPARSFIPASSFGFASIASRSVRRPLYSHVCNRCDGSSGSGLRPGLVGLSRRRALWTIQNTVSIDRRMRNRSVRLISMSTSSGAVDSIKVDAGLGKEWSVSKVWKRWILGRPKEGRYDPTFAVHSCHWENGRGYDAREFVAGCCNSPLTWVQQVPSRSPCFGSSWFQRYRQTNNEQSYYL